MHKALFPDSSFLSKWKDGNAQIKEKLEAFTACVSGNLAQKVGYSRFQQIRDKMPLFDGSSKSIVELYCYVVEVEKKFLLLEQARNELEKRYKNSPYLHAALDDAWKMSPVADERVICCLAEGRHAQLNQAMKAARRLAKERCTLKSEFRKRQAAFRATAREQRNEEWIERINQLLFPHMKLCCSAPLSQAVAKGELTVDEGVKELVLRCKYIDRLRGIEKYSIDEETRDMLEVHCKFLFDHPSLLSPRGHSAYAHIIAVLDELEKGSYPAQTQKAVLYSLLRMTSPGEAPRSIKKEQALAEVARKYIKRAPPQGQRGEIIKDEQGRPLAKLRVANGWGGCKEAEWAAYKVDEAIGGRGVPTAIRLDSGWILQKYIPNSNTLFRVAKEDPFNANLLAQLDTVPVQLHATYALFRGRGDGHYDNTVFDGKSLFDIDEEDNFLVKNMYTDRTGNEGNEMCMAALGLPQCNEPYSRLVLMLFDWEGIGDKIIQQLDRQGLGYSRYALEQRLDRMRELFRYESQQEVPSLTPRTLFFFLHGKDFNYYKFKEKGYHDIEIFGGRIRAHDDCRPNSEEKERFLPEIKDSPFNPDSFPGDTYEQYPGRKAIEQLQQGLIAGPHVDIDDIADGHFNQQGWNAYLQDCHQRGAPVKTFMLAYFLKGYYARLVRYICYCFPHISLAVVENKLRAAFGSKEFERLTEKIRETKKRGDAVVLMALNSDNFHFEEFEKKMQQHSEYEEAHIVSNSEGVVRDFTFWINQMPRVWSKGSIFVEGHNLMYHRGYD